MSISGASVEEHVQLYLHFPYGVVLNDIQGGHSFYQPCVSVSYSADGQVDSVITTSDRSQ